ncbi:MAG TPA: histidine kinase [Burkholderiaceae bacterium]|nr:histidine kinase [Burkholderiaceae bacterium]
MSDFATTTASTWKRVSSTAVRLFHQYANWLVGISWWRFGALAILLLILTAIVQKLPPFRTSWSEIVEDVPTVPIPPVPKAAAPVPPKPPEVKIEAPNPKGGKDEDVVISIDKNGVRITPRAAAVASAASGAEPAAAASGAASAAASGAGSSIEIALPGATRETIREAVRAAKEAAREAAAEARQQAEEARREAQEAVEEARRDAEEARRDAEEANAQARHYKRTRVVHLGDSLTDLAFFWIVASAVLKFTYKGRVQADARAAEATETAESEQLKRQVVEARMAAMQAQVEPHFLFNTLASIDHLIETDPPRASQMQKNLIALLRASMPAMRENHPAAHNLGREMAVIRPYLEILKVRMEDRLQTEISVPDGLLSADFPSMMIQSLVENAIKHGLEPKAEGGKLTVRAEIVHGKLAVTVADTGLGFGKAATAGTGVGLNNIRERLQLLYGHKASMTVAENTPTGTLVTLTVPYQAQTREGMDT